MERLMFEFEFEVGDGYTYSATCSLPFIYKSKAAALIDLEEFFIDKSLLLTDLQEQKNVLYDKQSRYHNQGNFEEKLNIANQINVLVEKIKNELKIDFGGQSLSLEDFLFMDDKFKYDYLMPQVFDLNEYFKGVEENIVVKMSDEKIIRKNKL